MVEVIIVIFPLLDGIVNVEKTISKEVVNFTPLEKCVRVYHAVI